MVRLAGRIGASLEPGPCQVQSGQTGGIVVGRVEHAARPEMIEAPRLALSIPLVLGEMVGDLVLHLAVFVEDERSAAIDAQALPVLDAVRDLDPYFAELPRGERQDLDIFGDGLAQ